MDSAIVPYWDIRPRSIVQPYDETAKSVPVRVVGDPNGDVSLYSTDPSIAGVVDGNLNYGGRPGAAVVVAEAIRDGVVVSRRYLQVEVYQEESGISSLVKDITPTGYVERLDDGTWHFKYFTEWFDQYGSNIRVTGELAITLELDWHYWMYFDVWGEIEGKGGANHDTLDVYLNNKFIRRLNPSWNVPGAAWDTPCPIPLRTESVDLWEFTQRTVTVRFRWDTRDAYYQTFQGWFVNNMRLVRQG